MTVEFLEEYRAQDGRWFRIGQIAQLPDEEARALVTTGRAKEFVIREDDEAEEGEGGEG